MQTADINGVSLNYRIDGVEGAPWVTFSNSLATDLAMWDGQVRALEDTFHILRYDTRGHGESSGPSGNYTFDELVSDVVGLWDQLGIQKSHFAGLSLGGMTGLGLLLNHRHRIDRAAICDCRADAPDFFADMWIERRQALTERGIEAVVEGNLERWFTPEFVANAPPLLDSVRDMIRRTSANGFMGCTGALMKLDYLKDIPNISGTATFVVGADDGPHPEVMQEMSNRLKGSNLIIIENAAHLPNLEQPDAFNQALLTAFGQ